MNGARDELLAGARLAVDEDASIAVGDATDEAEHATHRGAEADDVLERSVLDRGERAKTLHLVFEAAMLDGASDSHHQQLRIHGLGDEIVGANADRADRALQAALSCDDDDGDVGTCAEDALAQLETAHLGHRQIRENEVEILDPNELQSVLGRRAGRHRIALSLQHHLQQVTGLLFIVDHEYLPFGHGGAHQKHYACRAGSPQGLALRASAASLFVTPRGIGAHARSSGMSL